MGIDVDKVVVFTFALGGAMAGIAGVFYAFVFKQVYFFMGFTPGIKAFGAAVLGGIGSIPGAMLGGFFLGLVESVGPALFLDGIGIPAPYQLRDLIAFTLAHHGPDLPSARDSWASAWRRSGHETNLHDHSGRQPIGAS